MRISSFVDILPFVPLPLGDLRKIYFAFYCNKNIIVTNENRLDAMVNVVLFQKE